MYDRLDLSKGRYVRYDYQPKGDRFTRGLSPMPPVVTTVTRTTSTGRSFRRRVRVNNTKHLTVAALLKMIGPQHHEEAEEKGLYFLYKEDGLEVRFKEPGVHVRFTSTAQHKGRRLWFLCPGPGCGRRVGKLRLVEGASFGHLWGCQKCLGLAYASQAAHKTPALDKAIIRGEVKVSFRAWCKASEREEERLMKSVRRYGLSI